MIHKYDFLIIGAGIAGMSYALKIAKAHKGRVCMICKTTLDEANTSFAQGGVASVTNLAVDDFDKHIKDTMIAGDYISDRKAVEQVVRNAPAQIKELVEWAPSLTARRTAVLTSTARAATASFASCTMPTTREPRFSAD